MKRFLLCATDSGGARNLSPLIRVIKERGYSPVLVTSRDMLPLFNTEDIETLESDGIDSELAERLVNSIEPIAIICGTTRYMSAERFLTAAAKNLRIRSVVVTDEWFNYRMRFEDEAGQLVYLPDAIAVMDELAKKEAVEDSLPAERCYITGSPSLATLVSQAEKFVSTPPDIPEFLESNHVRPVITFISETHAADYGSKPGECGPMGSFLGYTEYMVKDDILTVLKNIVQPCTFVEKLHPGAEEENSVITYNGGIRWIRVKKVESWPLLWHSNAIIGMRSMALLEARLLGQPVVSYQPGLLSVDYCSAVRLGLIPRLSTQTELEQWCRTQLAKSDMEPKRTVRRFPFARRDAPDRVVRLALTSGEC